MTDTLPQSYQQRFAGIARLYGEKALQRLYTAHFVVAGLGGVGSWSAEALARSGVGRLTLIDMDDICVSNSNRQLHTVRETIGLSKTQVMADRLLAINPLLQVTVVDDFLDADNLAIYLGPQHDVVIDA
ncbi:MAG TPA: ThiF family adenylyltransferase, partial [Pseudomonadales bacterium]